MTNNTDKKKMRPLRTALICAAAAAMMVVSVAAANPEGVEDIWITLQNAIRVDQYRTDVVTDSGEKVSVISVPQARLENRDGRAILMVNGKDVADITDALALYAIQMIHKLLINSFQGDMESRAHMHYAQCLAGMAFSNALLGIVHSMAHKTGAAFSTGHITHGCANAMYLPFVIKYNAKEPAAASRYAEIARRMGLSGTSEQALINSLCEKIDDFNVKLNIPKTLKDFGIDETEFKEKIAKISELAVGDACTGSNPRTIDPAAMEKLFTCIYYGTEVDF